MLIIKNVIKMEYYDYDSHCSTCPTINQLKTSEIIENKKISYSTLN